jgi:hypothetical protein
VIVRVGPHGEVDLQDLFTKATIKKIDSYSMDIGTLGTLRVWFYDSRGKEIKIKLRKRRRVKKEIA